MASQNWSTGTVTQGRWSVSVTTDYRAKTHTLNVSRSFGPEKLIDLGGGLKMATYPKNHVRGDLDGRQFSSVDDAYAAAQEHGYVTQADKRPNRLFRLKMKAMRAAS